MTTQKQKTEAPAKRAFRAKSVKGDKKVDGREFSGNDFRLYVGEPTKAQLADNDLHIETIAPANPWPGSSQDRNGKVPDVFEVKRLKGEWPTPRMLQWEAYVVEKLEETERVSRVLHEADGLKGADLQRAVRNDVAALHGSVETGAPPDLAFLRRKVEDDREAAAAYSKSA